MSCVKIIFHGGPTNSGKTYNALQRLMEAKNGLYLGPLRLLAAEVYETLTSDGIYTNLFTGQERREIAFSTHSSATVEMANTNEEYDVVVIDEIQMIKDTTRGAAWTKALLGLRCKEIHVCGGLEAKLIVQKIAKACGDEFVLHKYKRFAPLKVADRSISSDPNEMGCYKRVSFLLVLLFCVKTRTEVSRTGTWHHISHFNDEFVPFRFVLHQVQPGDCVVAFSRNDIFAIKREIEKTTGYKCCVIYGKLPPQTRTDQARRFNDPNSGYDILVASGTY
jgi:ATP-dependent RNA helicase SUPV3L1/SUV3